MNPCVTSALCGIRLAGRGAATKRHLFRPKFPSRRARKWPNGSSTGSLRHVVCGLFSKLSPLVFWCYVRCRCFYSYNSVNDDHCRQHWTEQSGLVASRIDRLVRANRAIAVQAVAERRPIFYCLAGPKSHMSDIRKFASGINYKLPDFQFYCGFWSWSGRLLMFYEDFVLDAPIPLSFWAILTVQAPSAFLTRA